MILCPRSISILELYEKASLKLWVLNVHSSLFISKLLFWFISFSLSECMSFGLNYACFSFMFPCTYQSASCSMERGESILDAIFDEDSLEDVLDVEMMDVEEGGLVGHDLQIELGQTIGGNDVEVNQVYAGKNRRYNNKNKKKNRREKASSGPKGTDIDR
ncbi:uncharacterized protein LOC131306740 [Rhododendron vialii]|uniref:uncharacterized protein LOC131306740 n=1 Tax=Rhododendron vialii TaxID=182163 RepID=UPI00265EC8AA|nr:uncharacterized protein LOC131306740 [Rhododendron vialii]